MALADFLQGLALLETAGGAKTIKGPNGEDSYNLYNVKDLSGKGYRALDKAEGSRDAYRVYSSPDEATADIMGLLQRKYPAALQAQSPAEFAAALKQGGYATDPNYVSKLVGAINRVQSQGGSSTPDALAPFAAQGFGDLIAEARSRGYSDVEIAQRLQGAGQQLQQAKLQAQGAAVDGMGPATQLKAFRDAGYGELIDTARERAYTDKEIADRLGGAELQAGKDARDKADARGLLGNAWEGAKNAVGDVGAGAEQLGARFSGDDARLRELQAQRRAELSNLDRRATDAASGSGFGSFGVKALPYVAGAVATGGASLLPTALVQAGIGAAEGALTPTTGDGQLVKNILTDAAMAGGSAGLAGLAGKGLTSAASKVLGGSAEDAARVAQLLEQAKAQGLPVNAGTLSRPNGFWRNVLDASPESKAVQAFQSKADEALAGKVAQGLGLDGYAGPINHEMLQAATPDIKSALDNAANVSVKLPSALGDELGALVDGSANKLTEGIASNSVVKRAVQNLSAAAKEGGPVSGRALQELNSELKALVQGQTASVTEKQLAGQLIGRINNTLTGAMTPEQAAAFSAANKQYSNLMAVQNMVRASGDSGVVSPRQMLNAVKSGRFKNAFLSGDAPYQELAGTAAELYGPAAGRGLGSMLVKAVNGGAEQGVTAAVVNPTLGVPALVARKLASSALARLAASENPTVVKLLTGGKGVDPVMQQYIAKALAGTGALAGAQ